MNAKMASEVSHKATAPGVDIYSEEWFNITLPEKGPIANAVKEICKAYYIGGSVDPEIIYRMILDSIVKYLSTNKTVRLETGDGVYYEEVVPLGFRFTKQAFQSVVGLSALNKHGFIEFSPKEVEKDLIK